MSSKRFKYDHPEGLQPDQGYPWSVNRQILPWIPRGSRILELGCATGYMGTYLKETKNCRMTGIELDPSAAEEARKTYETVICANLNDSHAWAGFTGAFDVILCVAVLEHLIDPVGMLKALKPMLAPSGFIIVTLPNITHWSIRLHVMSGRFTYQDYGILDRTHLRFFTYNNAPELLTAAGFKLQAIATDPDAGIPLFNGIIRRLPLGWAFLRKLYSLRPNFFAYQILMKGTPQ